LFQEVINDLSDGGLLADASKECPDKPNVKYVDFYFREIA